MAEVASRALETGCRADEGAERGSVGRLLLREARKQTSGRWCHEGLRYVPARMGDWLGSRRKSSKVRGVSSVTKCTTSGRNSDTQERYSDTREPRSNT